MRRIYAFTILLAVIAPAAADDKFIDLTPLLPPQANAATVIDVQAIYDSPLAQKEKWATERPLPFPPTLYTVALASRIDPGSLSGGKWEVGVGRPKGKLTMEQLAAREKGAVEDVAGAQAVLSPRNVYFVEIRPWIIGMMCPADRQEVAKWVKSLRNVPGGVVRLDPFLKASVTSGDRLTQFIMAIDLADTINTADAEKEIVATEATMRIAGQMPPPAAAAKALATIQGVKLTLTVTDAIRGELEFEFAEPVAPFVPLAKPLLMRFLALHGASVEALEDWTAEAAGNAIVLRGSMREQGFRRILSLVAPPAPPADASESPLAAEIKMLSTQRYFKTILTYLDDLRKPSRTTQQDYAKFATWYDSFAQRIEQLPTYAVDEDVAKYGKATAFRLRGMAASLRGDLLDVQKLEQSITITPYIYGTSGWGRRMQPGVWLQSNQAEVQAKEQEQIQRGAAARQDLWSRIDNDTAAIAQALAARYKGTSGK
jgi:hypothetical protein